MPTLDSRFDAANLRTASTPDLLRLLLGRTRARPWLDLPLADLFQLRPISQHPGCREPSPEAPKAPAVLLVAKELLARSLHEDLARTAVIDQPDAARDLVRLRLAHLPHEVFAVALLDAQHRLLDFVILFRGTLQQTSVYPREVVKLALDRHAAAVILAHNHPSGLGDPSQADLTLTRTLKDALALIDVPEPAGRAVPARPPPDRHHRALRPPLGRPAAPGRVPGLARDDRRHAVIHPTPVRTFGSGLTEDLFFDGGTLDSVKPGMGDIKVDV